MREGEFMKDWASILESEFWAAGDLDVNPVGEVHLSCCLGP